jgi:hypothetical protein
VETETYFKSGLSRWPCGLTRENERKVKLCEINKLESGVGKQLDTFVCVFFSFFLITPGKAEF